MNDRSRDIVGSLGKGLDVMEILAPASRLA